MSKIIGGILLTGLIAFLVAGAIIRTVDRTGNVAEARGLGHGNGNGSVENQESWGDNNGVGFTSAPGDGTGTGQAQVEEWLTLQGTVASVNADSLVVQTTGGEQVTVDNRAWWFAQDQGFTAQAGDQVTVVGFYEDGDLEVGQIDDLTSGQTVSIRDESGRPLWAGRGRRGG
jgi:hypothetical protein